MSLEENLNQEIQQQQKIFTAIDKFESFIVYAGAGAGKTYTLIEAIKYILSHHLDTLHRHNQKIICITYTNVAVNEIRQRLGESQYIQVSTIHEMLWQQIRLYKQDELIELHKNKLEKELRENESEITNKANKLNLSYLNTEENKELFKQFVQKNKKQFFNLEKVTETQQFRKEIMKINQTNPILNQEILEKSLKNLNNFKTYFKYINKIITFQQAIEKINNSQNNNNILSVEYDSNSNSDRLASMKFSHDTLLEYSLQLVEKYDMFKKLLTDKYPYMFIDEYQDTNESVVRILANLHQYTYQRKQKWLAGYFGDSKQSIYDTGIGDNIENIYKEISGNKEIPEIKLKKIIKNFNRRSENQIIDLINKIRNDTVKQKPIDPAKKNGIVEFYFLKNQESIRNEENDAFVINQFINKYITTLNCNRPVDCQLLLNRSVAFMCGLQQIYSAIEKAEFIYWDNMNVMIFSHLLNKLHPAILRLYQLVTAYNTLNNQNTTLYDLFGNTQHKVTFAEASKLVEIFTNGHPQTLDDLIKYFSANLKIFRDQKENKAITFWLKNCFGINISDVFQSHNKDSDDSAFADYIYDNLYEDMYGNSDLINLESENANKIIQDNRNKIQNILNIELIHWQRWIAFINEEHDEDDPVIYHTYHGTKGEEYENVVIIMENSFGKRKKNKFKDYFSSLSSDTVQENKEEMEKKELENTRNLIYTACSRARKNLWILYLDDITDIKKEIESLFGTIKAFVPELN